MAPKNHKIEVLCTKEQHERIINHAHIKGFPTVSAFIRDFALRNPLTIEEKIAEIHQAIVRAKADGKPNYELYAPQDGYALTSGKEYSTKYKINPGYVPDPFKRAGLGDDYQVGDYN
ncbi:hypothetical protein KY347_03985 [Candidatus Woesearchaeota archaeon]|nr:hypothetical protein [Candidatus Woesearchaeota archaeon]